MKICENCSMEHDGTFGSGRFCSIKCSRGFSTKAKRREINKTVREKIIKNAHPEILKVCPVCEKEFHVKWNKRTQITCSTGCSASNRKNNIIYTENLSKSMKNLCNSLEARKRLRDIGRKGGYGKRSYTSQGTHCDSNFEKLCFEWLEENKINFEAHKNIPNSSKISDIYLPEKDIWIELDGINREKRKNSLGKSYEYWINKLEIYRQNSLNFTIIYNLEELQKYFREFA